MKTTSDGQTLNLFPYFEDKKQTFPYRDRYIKPDKLATPKH